MANGNLAEEAEEAKPRRKVYDRNKSNEGWGGGLALVPSGEVRYRGQCVPECDGCGHASGDRCPFYAGKILWPRRRNWCWFRVFVPGGGACGTDIEKILGQHA